MKKLPAVITASLAVLVLAGCTGQGITNPVPATTASPTSTATQSSAPSSSAPSSTASSSASSAVITRSDTFHLHKKDGYQAVVTVAWHPDQIATVSQIPAGCRELWGNNGNNQNSVVHVISATLTATFPEVSGFTWPSSETPVGYAAEGGSYARIECDTQQSSLLHGLYPAQSIITQTWMTVGTKTPNNPEGTPLPDPGVVDLPRIGIVLGDGIADICDEAPKGNGGSDVGSVNCRSHP